MYCYLETPRRVATLSAVAHRVFHIALVDVFARFTRVVHFVARIAYTPIVADGVLASAVGTHGRVLSALVYVYGTNGKRLLSNVIGGGFFFLSF